MVINTKTQMNGRINNLSSEQSVSTTARPPLSDPSAALASFISPTRPAHLTASTSNRTRYPSPPFPSSTSYPRSRLHKHHASLHHPACSYVINSIRFTTSTPVSLLRGPHPGRRAKDELPRRGSGKLVPATSFTPWAGLEHGASVQDRGPGLRAYHGQGGGDGEGRGGQKSGKHRGRQRDKGGVGAGTDAAVQPCSLIGQAKSSLSREKKRPSMCATLRIGACVCDSLESGMQ